VLMLQPMGLGGRYFNGVDDLSVIGANAREGATGLGLQFVEDERWATSNPVGLEAPNAEVVLPGEEPEHWTGDDPADSVFQPTIERTLAAVDGRLGPIRGGDEVVSGMGSLATAGHLALSLEGAGQQVLVVVDALVSIHSAFEHPEWGFLLDADEAQTGRMRRKPLDRAATDQVLLLGYHFPFPGIGYALRSGDTYRWHPAGWRVLS
jgi:hypothetical protein